MDPFKHVVEAIDEIAQGKMIIVTDNEDRENEGDLIMAGSLVTSQSVNFMAKEARGLICCPISAEYANRLGLSLMTTEEDKHGTAFTLSCDLKSGTTTGISAMDRAKTIKALASPNSISSDFHRPGHIFPLIGQKGGLSVRQGHTEAALDLVHLAGLTPCCVICEIINDDGTMAKGDDLELFQKKHHLKKITIKDLKSYREYLFKKRPISIPTEYGSFFLETIDNPGSLEMPHLLIYPKSLESPLNLRIHSECLTGDLLGSQRCDCGDQLNRALCYIHKNGGALLYLRQEGRGIGLINKLRTYNLQDQGFDTMDANIKLGFKADERDYSLAASLLKERGVSEVNLLTNNPLKIDGLESEGIRVLNRIPLEGRNFKQNKKYLHTKKERMGHILSMGE